MPFNVAEAAEPEVEVEVVVLEVEEPRTLAEGVLDLAGEEAFMSPPGRGVHRRFAVCSRRGRIEHRRSVVPISTCNPAGQGRVWEQALIGQHPESA